MKCVSHFSNRNTRKKPGFDPISLFVHRYRNYIFTSFWVFKIGCRVIYSAIHLTLKTHVYSLYKVRPIKNILNDNGVCVFFICLTRSPRRFTHQFIFPAFFIIIVVGFYLGRCTPSFHLRPFQ